MKKDKTLTQLRHMEWELKKLCLISANASISNSFMIYTAIFLLLLHIHDKNRKHPPARRESLFRFLVQHRPGI